MNQGDKPPIFVPRVIGSRLPTMKEAVDILGLATSRLAQDLQLSFVRETQGEEFAQQVRARAIAAGVLKR